MQGGFASRVLRTVAQVRDGEAGIALLMFAYSFLAMTSYNIIRPLTRSRFISDLGAGNLPYVLLAGAVVIAVVMHWYTAAAGRLARRHVIPVTQAGIVVLLVVFSLLLRTRAEWVTVAFYVFGQILGILLISQFWTLANEVAWRLRCGEAVLVHCAGGVGRTAMFAVSVLLALGEPRNEAERLVSRAGSTVETIAQMEMLTWCAARPIDSPTKVE